MIIQDASTLTELKNHSRCFGRTDTMFPEVDIDLIQQVKISPGCDNEETLMRVSSINVVLKAGVP